VPILSIITFLPLVGALVALAFPEKWTRWITAGFMVATLGFVGQLLVQFDKSDPGMQMIERFDWIPQIHVQYLMGVDGISVTMVALSALLSFIVMLGSWNNDDRPKIWFILLLLLEAGMNGVFVALDFILFYVFWEWVLIPMYFIMAWWGKENRSYVSLKFFLYMLLGSVLILLGIIAMYLNPAGRTFDMMVLATRHFPVGFQNWVFLLFYFGFAVRVPVWPFHTGHSDAHIQAPTAGSVTLAGVLLKTGTYGLLRVSLPMLPEGAHHWAWFVGTMACAAIIYGSVVAFWQPDLKKMLAYSSVGHMGFAMLGIAAGTVWAINGAMVLAFAHGVITGLLFLVVGMIYDRAHTRMAPELEGVGKQAPVLGGMLAFAAISSLGLPGLAGFVGEFLVLVGAWQSDLPKIMPVIAGVGMLLGAAYMLWVIYRVVYGEPTETVKKIDDARPIDIATAGPLIAITAIIGVNWNILLSYVDPAVTHLVAWFSKGM
jgi:NADH-quinone oxidoreductase subunit M